MIADAQGAGCAAGDSFHFAPERRCDDVSKPCGSRSGHPDLQQPRFAGFTRDSRPYVFTAQRAAQDITNPDRIELDQIHATLASNDSDSFELSARSGILESKADRLTLLQEIIIDGSAYQARLLEAVINVRTGHVVSDKPVEVKMLQGTVKANHLELVNSGEIIRFGQGVIMLLEGAEPDRQAAFR